MDNVYVADTRNNRVLKLEAASGAQIQLPFNGLNSPVGVAVGTDGDVYVADSNNRRILKLPPGTAAPIELPFAGLRDPVGVAVDGSGNVYLADDGRQEVLKLSVGAMQPDELPFGPISPRGVAVDLAGNVYVVDGNGRVVEMPAGWNASAEVPISGLKEPTAVAVDSVAGTLYVVDSGNNRVLKVPLR